MSEVDRNSGARAAPAWRVGTSKVVTFDQPRVMSILNVTPDSFSDGGELASVEDVVRAAAAAIVDGAELLDIGGESTRPGAARVSVQEQIARVVPAIEHVRRELGDSVAITVDTTLSEVAERALDAGADGVNDVSGGTEDAAMLPLCARRGCGVILMHRLIAPGADVYSHQYVRAPAYAGGVVEAVGGFLSERVRAAEALGVDRESMLVDPGLGFGKTVEQNLELIRGTGRVVELASAGGAAVGVLSALSRKSFVAKAAGMSMEAPARERAAASVELSLAHLLAGARIFRVHDVAMHAQALKAAFAGMRTG